MEENDLAKKLFDQEMMRVSKDELKEVGFTKMEALTLLEQFFRVDLEVESNDSRRYS